MQFSAGGQHTCAVTDAENLLCWGDDSQAQRGKTLDDPDTVKPDPHVIDDAGVYLAKVSRVLDGAKQVAAGGAHTCALLNDATVKCWGRSAEGQVDGSTDRPMVDVPVSADVRDATQIDAGAFHTCAVVPDGVVCWGSSRYGQAGRRQSDALAPGLVPGTEDALAVATGVRHTCARLESMAVVCWGELIDETGAPYVTALATPVSGLDDAVGITAGAGHSCALKKDFTVVCWGANDSGQLGDGTTTASATPVAVLGLESGVGQVAAGGGELDGRLVGHSCAIDRSTQVACWGRGQEGQLGVGLGIESPDRVVVLLARIFDNTDRPTLSGAVNIELGAFHSCALRDQGSVYCWGDDTSDQLGWSEGISTDQRDDPKPIPGRAGRVERLGSMR
jgi:alpha-tubulin suppressor-like RCC1 family protein